MKIRFLLFIFTISLITIQAQNKVYVAVIDGEIDLGLAPYVKRAVSEAEMNKADVIIFKINTFGGRVDAATQIKDAILDCKVKTVAFINKRAISAGSLIALSCQTVVMVPGASIGATTVVDQAGNKQAEKYQSYMRSEMRATAERNNRRTDVAEAMVDERVVIEGLVDSTQLVTLTSAEAVQWGMADTVLADMNELTAYLNVSNPEEVSVESNWGEDVVRFLNNPVISSLLMMIGLVGFFAEVKTPGWGLPGTAAVIALVLFFGSGFIVDMVSVIEIIIFIAGAILLLLEIFVIPGFGIFGIAGIILMVASLFLGLLPDLPVFSFSSLSIPLIQLASAFAMSFILMFILSKILPKSNYWNRLILQEAINQRSGYSSEPDIPNLIHKTGKALSDLRPSGIAMIEDHRIDVVTEGDYIKNGSKIKVTNVEGSKVTVRKI